LTHPCVYLTLLRYILGRGIFIQDWSDTGWMSVLTPLVNHSRLGSY